MASFGKRQRDQERLAKAAQKRDRRQSRQSNSATDDAEADSATSATSATGESDNQAILAQIEALHGDFEAHRISFDDYEKQRDELLERIQI